MKLVDIVAGCFGTARRVMFAAEGAPPTTDETAGYRFVEFGAPDLESHGLFRERDRPIWFPRRLQDGHRLFGWRDPAGDVADPAYGVSVPAGSTTYSGNFEAALIELTLP